MTSNKELLKARFQALQKEVDAAEERKLGAEEERDSLSERVKSAEAHLKDCIKPYQENAKKLAEMEIAKTLMQKKITDLLQSVERNKEETEDCKRRLARAEEGEVQLEERLVAAKERQKGADKKLGELERTNKQHEEELDKLNSVIDKGEGKLSKLQQDVYDLQKSLRMKRLCVAAQEHEAGEKSHEMKELDAEVEHTQAYNRTLLEKVQAMKMTIDEQREETTRVEDEHAYFMKAKDQY